MAVPRKAMAERIAKGDTPKQLRQFASERLFFPFRQISLMNMCMTQRRWAT
jgi:hypothetical protein